MNILALNSGSSSVKFKVVAVGETAGGTEARFARVRDEGAVEEIGPQARLAFLSDGERVSHEPRSIQSHTQAVRWMLKSLETCYASNGRTLCLDAIGHRVVHGGERFQEPVVIDETVVNAIHDLVALAPLHNPGCLAGIEGARSVFGADMPMVAVFDTGFHRTLPPRAATYALDLDLARKHGIHRYGFHGIAHASLTAACAAAAKRSPGELRLITLQLGNGCSAAAIDRGRSVDTSMGFTPLEGLVMGTRSGDLDPALVGYLARREGLSLEAVERGLNERSGLLGLSGVSHDMRELRDHAVRDPDSRAALAIEVFCYRITKYVGAYLAVLGGADAVVFGGGIGAHAPSIRAKVCEGLGGLGIELDQTRNDETVGVGAGEAVCVSTPASPIACYVAGVDEEFEIARATVMCLKRGRS